MTVGVILISFDFTVSTVMTPVLVMLTFMIALSGLMFPSTVKAHWCQLFSLTEPATSLMTKSLAVVTLDNVEMVSYTVRS